MSPHRLVTTVKSRTAHAAFRRAHRGGFGWSRETRLAWTLSGCVASIAKPGRGRGLTLPPPCAGSAKTSSRAGSPRSRGRPQDRVAGCCDVRDLLRPSGIMARAHPNFGRRRKNSRAARRAAKAKALAARQRDAEHPEREDEVQGAGGHGRLLSGEGGRTASGPLAWPPPCGYENTTVLFPWTSTRSSQCQRTARARTRRSRSRPRCFRSSTESRCETRPTSCSMIGPASSSAVT